jgi:hypothetical protein
MRFRITVAMVAMLLFGMVGVATAQEGGDTGTLVFRHLIEGGPAVDVVVSPFQGEDTVELGTFLPGEVYETALPAGTHDIRVFVNDTLLMEGPFVIEAGATTVVKAMVDEEGNPTLVVKEPKPDEEPKPSPSASASPSASPSDDDDQASPSPSADAALGRGPGAQRDRHAAQRVTNAARAPGRAPRQPTGWGSRAPPARAGAASGTGVRQPWSSG